MKRSAIEFVLLPLGKSLDHAVLWFCPVLAKCKQHVVEYSVIIVFKCETDLFFQATCWGLKWKSASLRCWASWQQKPFRQQQTSSCCVSAHQAYSIVEGLILWSPLFAEMKYVIHYLHAALTAPCPTPLTPSKKMKAFFGIELLYLWHWSQETVERDDMANKLNYLSLLL